MIFNLQFELQHYRVGTPETAEKCEKRIVDHIAAQAAEIKALQEALKRSTQLLEETDKHAKFPNHAYSMTARNIESHISMNHLLLTKRVSS